MIWDGGSVSSVDWVQSSQISGGELSDDSARFVGALGGVVSVTAGVVTDKTLLCAVLPEASRARTWNVYVVDGVRSRTV